MKTILNIAFGIATAVAMDKVVQNYIRYLGLMATMNSSEYLIQKIEERPNRDSDECKREMAEYVKERDLAADEMEKYKFTAKLVKMFPPRGVYLGLGTNTDNLGSYANEYAAQFILGYGSA